MRNHTFEINEFYHIYNRGVDKRDIILDEYDLYRFIQCLEEFNTTEPIRSIYEQSFIRKKFSSSTTKKEPLVAILVYCINPNHFHLLLTPLQEKGIEKFMQRVGGYTRYFNEKNKRNGALFQGRFKSKHIKDTKYLLHLSAYINMNNRDKFGSSTTKLSKSSLEEYTKNHTGICAKKEMILSNFKTQKEYLDFAISSWKDILKRKIDLEQSDFTS